MDKTMKMEEIRERIINDCTLSGAITGHGNWCLGLLRSIEQGEEISLPEKDSGLELFGLENWVNFI